MQLDARKKHKEVVEESVSIKSLNRVNRYFYILDIEYHKKKNTFKPEVLIPQLSTIYLDIFYL